MEYKVTIVQYHKKTTLNVEAKDREQAMAKALIEANLSGFILQIFCSGGKEDISEFLIGSVLQIDRKGNIIACFPTPEKAIEVFGNKIKRCLEGQQKTLSGYSFRYAKLSDF